MAKMIVPTRNRSTSLLGLMSYLDRFYPGTELIVADGSNEFHKAANAANVKKFDKIKVDYRPYPEELSFFERLLDVVTSQADDYMIIGSDDDFPMMEVLAEGETYLREHPECATAMGALISLLLKSDDLIQVRLNPARNIDQPTVRQRLKKLGLWPFTTSYAVTRRDVLVERYERHCKLYLAGFYDFIVSVYDATRGTIKAIPTIGYITTRNYNHAYWRTEDDLIFLRRSETVLQVIDVFKQDLMHYEKLEEEEARKEAENLMCRRIAEHVGNPPYKRPGFADSPIFRNPVVQKQYRMFHNLFREGTPVRQRYQEKLEFIAQCLMRNAKSPDNQGEPHKSETMVGKPVKVSG